MSVQDIQAINDLSGIIITYDNWIDFKKSLIVSVDSFFALARKSDPDVQHIIDDLAGPAVKLIKDNFYLDISHYEVVQIPEKRQFLADSDYTDWYQRMADGPDLPAILNLHTGNRGLGIGSPKLNEVDWRWRGKIEDVTVTFNSLTPRRVYIHGRLRLNILVRFDKSQIWQGVTFSNEDELNALSDWLRMKINETYYIYLSHNFGLAVSATGFSANDEK